MRKITVTPNYVKFGDGSCLFQTGDTKVLCVATINEDRVPPHCEAKEIGWVSAEYAMLPHAGKERTARQRSINSGRTHEIQRLIGRSLRAIVDLSKLGRRTIVIDCDVIQADGGTRTASINGAYIALSQAIAKLIKEKKLFDNPIKDSVGATSVGMVKNKLILDMCAAEDNEAQVDMNVVMTGSGKFIEVQATAEGKEFSGQELNKMLNMAGKGIKEIIKIQKKIVKI
ncbi:MAG: ribonuclease PH [Elusimicrobia bacterium RIFOXYA2_FULL_39_19]|nr:MAG: ribonuclease PH [Elusimicrobia bacterium RIFOXYA2_FULL_39_19]